jgi:hypothetical protein
LEKKGVWVEGTRLNYDTTNSPLVLFLDRTWLPWQIDITTTARELVSSTT